MENLNIVIVGHVDHGKSTLIGRLFYDTNSLPEGKVEELKTICKQLGKDLEFGFLLDHLEEERDQGITIDTTQAFFRTTARQYTIIDAPGHAEFVKNMITGASQAEAAILIVDAGEGVQEQTQRHAYILGMLGLSQVIVVLNKMDTVGYSEGVFCEVRDELLAFLGRLKINPRHIIPISARHGDFIAKRSERLTWYDGPTVLEALDSFKASPSLSQKPLRFPVQDVYNWGKRIIAGRLASGTIRVGDEITIMPSGEKTAIATIEEYGKSPGTASAGKSIGITTKDKVFADRGSIIAAKPLPAASKEFCGRIFWMDKEPYKPGERLLLRCATQEMRCSLEITRIINSSTLEPKGTARIENRDVADIIIRTEQEIVTDSFSKIPEMGRFVLQRKDTCAGGIII
ncbi:MAG: GTP-binding protein [archaeon]